MKYNRYPKRDAIKNYFPLPNEIFVLSLSTGELSVYSYLMYCEDRKTFQCHPSYKTISKAIRKSENAVRKYVIGLKEKGLITTEPTSIFTKDGRKQNGSLLYTIRPIQEALNSYYQRQLAQAEEAVAKARVEKQLAKRNAVQFYSGYLATKNSDEYLAPVLTQIMRGTLDGFGAHISRNLFRLTVEEAKIWNLIAGAYNVTPETLQNHGFSMMM